MSHLLQISFAPDPIPAEAPIPSANLTPPRLRLVEKPAKSENNFKQNYPVNQEKAAEATARVAARFAAMPGYGYQQRAEIPPAGLSGPAQSVNPLGWLNEEQNGTLNAEPADILTRLFSNPAHLTSPQEEKVPMNSNAIAGTQNTHQEEPMSRSLVARRLRQQGISINGSVQLSIFEVEPAEFASSEPIATASESTPTHLPQLAPLAVSDVEPVSPIFLLHVAPADYVDELPEREAVSTASTWHAPAYAVEMAPSVTEAEILPDRTAAGSYSIRPPPDGRHRRYLLHPARGLGNPGADTAIRA